MSPFWWMSTFGAAAALALGGFLFGARAGRSARRTLAASLERERSLRMSHEQEGKAEARSQAALETELGRAHESSRRLEQELAQARAHAESLQQRWEHEMRELTSSLDRRLAERATDSAQLRNDVRSLLSPLVGRDGEVRNLSAMVNELVRPIVERERMGQELGRVDPGVVRRAQLPQLLKRLADKGGFAHLLLSDERGLLLASSDEFAEADTQAAIAGMLLQLADRVVVSGAPRPMVVLLRDEAHQILLHRIFYAAEERYVLTALTKGLVPSPDVLDGALVRIEQLLGVQGVA